MTKKPKRLMVDSCVIFDLLLDNDRLENGAMDLLNDYEARIFASFETLRELVVSFNSKDLLQKKFNTAKEVLDAAMNGMGITFLPLKPEVSLIYADLKLNTLENHKDPSDHIIISHAIAEHIPLLSRDTRFWFYQSQGLDLIEY